MRKIITVVILLSIINTYSFAAQNELVKNSKYNINSASEYVFESYPNQDLIPIRLIGAIKNAGLYHIPSNMKLITLLALAGGTTTEADLENILIGNDQPSILNVTNNEKKSLNINLEQSLKDGSKSDYTLVSNDIILIKNKTPLISNDTFRMVTIFSVILTSLLTALVIKDKYSK